MNNGLFSSLKNEVGQTIVYHWDRKRLEVAHFRSNWFNRVKKKKRKWNQFYGSSFLVSSRTCLLDDVLNLLESYKRWIILNRMKVDHNSYFTSNQNTYKYAMKNKTTKLKIIIVFSIFVIFINSSIDL